MFESDTIKGFLVNTISYFIEKHDEATDGESTGVAISFCQKLKDLIKDNIQFTYSRGMYIFKKLGEIAGKDQEGYDTSSDIEELADEINNWD